MIKSEKEIQEETKNNFLKEYKKEQRMRVWWIPQVPMKSFYVEVNSLEQAILIDNTLAQYDLFQFNNKIKPDYCNAGGVELYVGDREEFDGDEWTEYFNDELYIGDYNDAREMYCEYILNENSKMYQEKIMTKEKLK
jgi:hypothetical protein